MLARTNLPAGRQEPGGINADTPEAENEEV